MESQTDRCVSCEGLATVKVIDTRVMISFPCCNKCKKHIMQITPGGVLAPLSAQNMDDVKRAYSRVFEDPGNHLADNCTLCAIPMMVFIIAAIFASPIFLIPSPIFLILWVRNCLILAVFNGSSIFQPIFLSLTVGWFSFPFVILKRIGIHP